ncbi:unnamed protein product [Choristocarpus tenellus]
MERRSNPKTTSRRRKISSKGDKHLDGERIPNFLVKKAKISHYFEEVAPGRSRKENVEQSTLLIREGQDDACDINPQDGSGGINSSGSRRTGTSGRKALATSCSAEPSLDEETPSWGKLVDPRQQQGWSLLRRIGLVGRGGVVLGSGKLGSSIAWAQSAFSLVYTPVFQDGRPPGVGSTSQFWGAAGQSQVFGGGKAVYDTSLPPLGTDHVNGRKSGYWTATGDGDKWQGEEVSTDGLEMKAAHRWQGGKGNESYSQLQNFRLMHHWLVSSPVAASQHFPLPVTT